MATKESRASWNADHSDLALSSENDLFTFSLTYPGKQSPEAILQTDGCQTITLRDFSTPEAAPNRLYFGDNLPILASLLDIPEVRGKVKLIYIDPPFSTNGVFKSRSRKDAYSDLLRGHQFVEFIRQRLILLRELLTDDGSIYVHLDNNMIFHVKTIMDEIFGAKNFRSLITRRKCNPKNYTRLAYGNISDYLLFYTKSPTYTWNRPLEAWTQERLLKEYPYIEQETGRRYKKVPIHAPGERNGKTGQQWRGKFPPSGKHWQYTPSRLDEMDARGEIFWSSNGNPRRKIYADQTNGIPIQDIWLDVRDAHNQNIKITGYPTEKPPALLSRIIEASSNSGDWVLDCFAGSGTTLAEANRLGRRWIGIDNSPEAIKTILERFQNGLSPMGDYVQPKSDSMYQLALPLEDTRKVDDFSLLASLPYEGELDTMIATLSPGI